MAVSYNKMSSIQIGGTYVNSIPIGSRGNVSLDCSGNSLFRDTVFMDASLNVSGLFNVGGDVSMNSNLFVGGNVSMNSKLNVVGDVSMNSKLIVGGDVSFNQNLYTIGNTSTKNLTLKDAYPTPTKTAQIGFDVTTPVITILTTGTTSNVGSGTAFKPISFVIPAGNASSAAYVYLPLNLFGSVASGVGTGTLTLTYTSVSMNIYKNSVLQSATGQSITATQFTGGSTKQAFFNGTGGGYPLYLGYYFGYFDIQFPITTFNTSADTYEIELTITASTSSGFTLSIASSGGSMGFGIVSPVIPFTETRVKSSTMTYISASTTPFVAANVAVDFLTDLKIISDKGLLISATNDFELKTNAAFEINSNSTFIINSNSTIDMNSVSSIDMRTGAGADFLINAGRDVFIDGQNVNLTSSVGDVALNATGGGVTINATDTFYTDVSGGVFFNSQNGDIDFTADKNLGFYALTGSVFMTAPEGTYLMDISRNMTLLSRNSEIYIAALGKNLNLEALTTMLLKSGGTNTLEVSGANKMVTSSTTTTINNTSHVINAGTTINGSTTINGDTSVNVDNTFNMMPTATIIQNLSNTVPAGFLYCDGGAVSRSTYARLFAAIGTTYGGGDGSTTFNKPNFKGAFLRGRESQTVSSVTYTAAALGTAQQDAVLTPLTASNQGYYNLSSGSARQCVARTIQTGDPVDTGTGILPRFDRTASENRPFNFAVNYYIRY